MARKGAVAEKTEDIVAEVEVPEVPTTMSAKELAKVLGTDPKTCRRFLRSESPDGRPGQGGRWAIPISELEATKAAWETRATKVAEAEATDEDIEELVDELSEVDELAELDD